MLFDTKNLTLRNQISDMRLKYKINRSWSSGTLDETLTIIPLVQNGSNVPQNLMSRASYHFLNVTENKDYFSEVWSYLPYHDIPYNGITIQNITDNDGPLAIKVSLDYNLMPYNGDLLIRAAFERNDGLVSEISFYLMLPFIFTDGSSSSNSSYGKYAINKETTNFNLRQNNPDTIVCEARGYPPPQLYIKRLNNDKTITELTFGSSRLQYFPHFHTSVFEIVIPKVEQHMEGDYVCIAEDISHDRASNITCGNGSTKVRMMKQQLLRHLQMEW